MHRDGEASLAIWAVQGGRAPLVLAVGWPLPARRRVKVGRAAPPVLKLTCTESAEDLRGAWGWWYEAACKCGQFTRMLT